MAPNQKTAHVIALSDLQEPSIQGQRLVVDESANPLHQIKTRLQVCVGNAVITVGELMALRERQVLTLDQGVDAPVDILLEGRVIARGQLVAVDDQFAVRISELPLLLKP